MIANLMPISFLAVLMLIFMYSPTAFAKSSITLINYTCEESLKDQFISDHELIEGFSASDEKNEFLAQAVHNHVVIVDQQSGIRIGSFHLSAPLRAIKLFQDVQNRSHLPKKIRLLIAVENEVLLIDFNEKGVAEITDSRSFKTQVKDISFSRDYVTSSTARKIKIILDNDSNQSLLISLGATFTPIDKVSASEVNQIVFASTHEASFIQLSQDYPLFLIKTLLNAQRDQQSVRLIDSAHVGAILIGRVSELGIRNDDRSLSFRINGHLFNSKFFNNLNIKTVPTFNKEGEILNELRDSSTEILKTVKLLLQAQKENFEVVILDQMFVGSLRGKISNLRLEVNFQKKTLVFKIGTKDFSLSSSVTEVRRVPSGG